MSPAAIDRDQVIVVTLVGQEVNQYSPMSQPAKGHGGEKGAVEAVSASLAEKREGRAVTLLTDIRNLVKQRLDPGW
jgi:hypothetical protein